VSSPLFTIANQLTLLRMLLIPAFVMLTVYDRVRVGARVFLVAGLTDALDGLMARLAGTEDDAGGVAGSGPTSCCWSPPSSS
jgi:phosphatidylglycerophosphate synthase